MGRRHSIVNKKIAGDAQKSKNYAKVGKLIELAVRQGGKDASMNPQLELMLQKARQYNLPKDVVEKAIKKGSGELDGEKIQEVLYEGYGPGGSALYIKCIASNTNRTIANVRSILAKMGGSIAEPGSVSWQFTLKGVIVVDGIRQVKVQKGNEVVEILPLQNIVFEEALLNMPVEDFETQEGLYRIITSREDFIETKKLIEQLGYSISQADLQYMPANMITLSGLDEATFQKILDALEEDDDVDSVYHNVL